jgi:hypothetical protein
MSSSIEAHVRECSACAQSDKSTKPIPAPIQPVDYPMKPWSKIALDIMGPFNSAPSNQRNVLVTTCYYSKWPEVNLCGDVTSSYVIRWLKHTFARYGLPGEIVTHNGPQFTSHEFTTFLQCNDIRHSKIVPYNPSANGMVERMNRSLKESIQAICLGGERWEDAVVTALYAYRSTPHRATNYTPAQLMLGRKMRTQLNAAFSIPEKGTENEKARRTSYQKEYSKHAPQLKVGSFVRLKLHNTTKGQTSFSKPLEIIRVCGPGTYELEDYRKVNARQCYTCSSRDPANVRPLPVSTTHLPDVTNPSFLRRSHRIIRPVDRFQ